MVAVMPLSDASHSADQFGYQFEQDEVLLSPTKVYRR